MTHMWKPEGNLQEFVPSGIYSGHGTWWQVPLLSEPKIRFVILLSHIEILFIQSILKAR